MKQIYVAWLRFQRRPLSMQGYFGYEMHFVSSPFNAKAFRLLDYVCKAFATASLVLRSRPDRVWVASGPVFAVQTVLLVRWLTRGRYQVVADCHNSTFSPPWSRMPFAARALNAVARCIVHNERVLAAALAMGVRRDKLVVLEDRPADPTVAAEADVRAEPAEGQYVVFPCGFRADEPIEIVLDAARQLDPLPVYITGDYLRMKAGARLADRSDNVRLTGFLDRGSFERLLAGAAAVVGLTDREGVQLSVANEAVGFELPMVLSSTETLRTMFPKGVVFVETMDPADIARGCRAALTAGEQLRREVMALRIERIRRWEDQARALQTSLAAAPA